MAWKSIVAVAALLAATSPAGTAFAGADDYAFEPVNAQIKSSNVATLAVRLVHKPSGKPVPAAAIVQTRIDMAPDGMASMVATIVPQPSPEPGVYAFKAPLTMTGRWLLTVSAKVQDEPETLTGKVIFTVGQ
jgi:YtkA-like protein